ncbi:MAG: hypothetical protein K9M96_07870 [Deltaproteobacteria bacterium]|nr:hypothetical protein [Deltaproteobacteria bacterium]MCF8120168.1 hypothetical protein [Deltaproteobacteria bacterium]
MSQAPYILKALAGWSFLLAATVFTLWVVLISLTSLWVGVKYIQHTGSWIPILSGAMLLTLGVWVYFRAATALYRRLKNEDTLD